MDFFLKIFVKNYKNTKDEKVRQEYGLFALFFGIVTNLILFLAKIILGSILRLYSLISDSINNLSDLGNNVLGIVGVKISAKKADDKHPYGHQRAEYIISLIIGCVVIALGAIMLYQGIIDCINFIKIWIDTGTIETKEISYTLYVVSLCIVSISILIKLLQSIVYYSLGKRINSLELKTLSKDSRNDIITTSSILITLIITWLTHYDIDFIFTIFISVFILISGGRMIKESSSLLLGEKPEKELIDRITNLVYSNKDVLGIHDLSIHSYGRKTFAVLHVEVDGRKDLIEAHNIMDDIERKVMKELNVSLTIHLDPVLVNDENTELYKKMVLECLKQYDASIFIHDFRLIEKTSEDVLTFDLVIPDEIDNENSKNKIENDIFNATNYKLNKKVSVIIDFDSKDTDFLYGSYKER